MLGDLCFRLRGALMAVLALYALVTSQPTLAGLTQGFALALMGEALRLWAISYAGEPTRGETLDAPRLVTAGPYAYVRNPLYVGNLLNSLGVLAGAFHPWAWQRTLVLGSLTILFYTYLGRHEEKFLHRIFGAQYEHYRQQVPAWIPGRKPYRQPQGEFCWRRGLRFERTSLVWWCAIWMVLAWKGWWMNSHV